MFPELHLKALSVEGKLWSFSVAVQLWKVSREKVRANKRLTRWCD